MAEGFGLTIGLEGERVPESGLRIHTDVTIRCHLLSECIHDVVDDITV